jgi:BirA family biotin operon repressor/biotin-[acetyl-CoA-carboxylase] ligase
MLLEQTPPWIVLGIGVDVAHAPAPSLYPTTCLRQIGSGAEPFDVLASVSEYLGLWYARWRQEGFAPIRQAWLADAVGLSGPVTVRLANETTLEGHFAGLDAEGALLLDLADGGQRRILAGDVFFPAQL